MVVVLSVALFLLPRCQGRRSFPERPNFVLILIDALRHDRVGLYGHSRNTTPFLDQLGQNGVVFEHAYSQSSQTFNATSTLFTSTLFPYRAAPRIAENEAVAMASLDPANLTLAEVMGENGYQTFAVFTNPHHARDSGFWQGFAESEYIEATLTEPYGRAPRVVDKFLGWLDRRSSYNREPFFAYLHFMDVHNPYDPPPSFRERFLSEVGRDVYMNGNPQGTQVPTDVDLAFMQALYDGEIRYVDSNIEELAEELASRSLWNDTVVIITSDHGDEFMEHGGLGHGKGLEKEMVHIPMILHSGTGSMTKRIGVITRNLDLAPTIVDIAGIGVPSVFQGKSLLPLILGSPWEPIPYSFAWVGPHASVTTSRWHLVFNRETGAERLYDNSVDPRGLRDIAYEHPDVVEALGRIVELHSEERSRSRRISKNLRSTGKDANSELDVKIMEQLRALGYLP